MDFQDMVVDLFMNLFFLASLVYLFVGILFLKKNAKLNIIFALLMFANAIYSFGYYLEINTIDLNIIGFIRNIEFLGTSFIPSVGILFILNLQRERIANKKLAISLYSVSLIIWLIFLSNSYHHLFYKSINFVYGKYFTEAITQKGLGYYLLLLYYVVFLISSCILLYKFQKNPKIRLIKKSSFRFLLFTFQIPWVAILFILFGFDKSADPTPFTIMIMCILFLINEIKNDMFELKIRRWKKEYEATIYPAVLIDTNEIIYLNKAATALFDKYTIKTDEFENCLADELTAQPIKFENHNTTEWFQISKQWLDLKKKLAYYIMIDVTDSKLKQDEIEFLSFNDQLTGLHNRRYYEREIVSLDKEECYPLSLIMIDVNGLKLTNDAFGHKTGDKLLQKISGILKSKCRENDVVARIGGDEFILLLPKTDEKNAEVIIDKINTAVNNEKMDNIILSVSVGYAVKQEKCENITEVFMKAEDDMYRHKLCESSSIRSKTIDLIMNTLFEKNNREMLHSNRVGNICEAIAKKMDFTKDEVNEIKIAGLMHDIGKIGISEAVLNSPVRLDEDEWREIKRHSEIGYRILGSVNEFVKIANYVLEHHEKFNGRGYPKGLKGDEISLQARIIAVADAYDAMTKERTYRKALTMDEAIEDMKRCAGTQFDPSVVNVFLDKVLKENLECDFNSNN